MNWYSRVIADPDDLTPIAEAIEYYERQADEARRELKVEGRIEQIQKRLPGMAEYRFNQLQELEAILKYLNIRSEKVRGEVYRKYMEGYARALSSRDADKYTDSDPKVIDMALLVNQVALTRNKFLGISKGIEYLHYQLNSIVKLRVAGIEDASL